MKICATCTLRFFLELSSNELGCANILLPQVPLRLAAGGKDTLWVECALEMIYVGAIDGYLRLSMGKV